MPKLPAIDLKTGTILSPHVLILGAGASAAVCPYGDRNGKQLPVMNNLISVVGLEELIRRSGYDVTPETNFEDVYDFLSRSNENAELLNDLENAVHEYFADIEIPHEATFYDYLLLGLRPKDLIATFNWDPLLAQAFRRNRAMVDLPQMVFLHGNVEIGICLEHRAKGFINEPCAECGGPLRPTKLLYPISRKDYDTDLFIHNQWKIVDRYISHAYLMLIFGYSAPKTDTQAKSIMHTAWDKNQTHELSEIEIVDLKPADTIYNLWAEFIVRQHYGVFKSIEHTWLFRHPRRTCEALAAATLQNHPLPRNPFPSLKSVPELQQWVFPLIQEERAYQKNGTPFSARVPF
jgi:hypothetical protein